MHPIIMLDVESRKMVKYLAIYIEKTGKVKVPENMVIHKTGHSKKLSRFNPHCFYLICASIIHHMYFPEVHSVKSIIEIFRDPKRNGSHGCCRSSGTIARKAIRALEDLKLVDKISLSERQLSRQCRLDIDRIAARVKRIPNKTNQRDLKILYSKTLNKDLN